MRTSLALFETRDVPLADFPEGEGPPVLMSAHRGEWSRLGFGESALVEFGDEPGGAFAFGLVRSVVVIWIYMPEDGPGRAYCYHAPVGPLGHHLHAMARTRLDADPARPERVYGVLASARPVTPVEEAAMLAGGIHDDKLFVYSGAYLAQFGVSSAGTVGEAG